MLSTRRLLSAVKPEYLWRPTQIIRRAFCRQSGDVQVLLPWSCTIAVSSTDVVGRAIASHGVYDLPVTEAIVRLAETCDTALDIGANIGYMSLVLGLATGPLGRVVSFEPNAEVLARLRSNVESWRSRPIAPIEINSIALSDRDGQGYLSFPSGYYRNSGMARLEAGASGVPVKLQRLDSLGIDSVGLMKIDVEGHEAAVLSGAQILLGRKRVRDIVFEEDHPYPARSHQLLLEHGYRIFRLTRSLWRPLLLPPQAPRRQWYLPNNFLATIDPSRAQNRFRAPGWMSLRSALFTDRSKGAPCVDAIGSLVV